MANNDIRMRVLLNVDGKSSVVEVSSREGAAKRTGSHEEQSKCGS